MPSEHDAISGFLTQLGEVGLKQYSFEADGKMYVVRRHDDKEWLVRKLEGELATDYTVTNFKGMWFCTCPAGERRRKCKHILWIDVVAKAHKAGRLNL